MLYIAGRKGFFCPVQRQIPSCKATKQAAKLILQRTIDKKSLMLPRSAISTVPVAPISRLKLKYLIRDLADLEQYQASSKIAVLIMMMMVPVRNTVQISNYMRKPLICEKFCTKLIWSAAENNMYIIYNSKKIPVLEH